MHQALQILEVLDAIFSHLDERSLANVCRTCRTFSVPGASNLWRHIEGRALGSLVNIVVGWEESDARGQLSFRARWARFAFYARFVQKLTVDSSDFNRKLGHDWNKAYESEDSDSDESSDSDDSDASTLFQSLQRLAALQRSPALLPCLRTLHWGADEPEHLDIFLLFLGPSVQRIEMNCGTELVDAGKWAVVVACVLEAIPERAPNIVKVLAWISHCVPSSQVDSLVNMITQLQRLQIFIIDFAWDPAILAALAHLPDLNHLDIESRTERRPEAMEETTTNIPCLDRTSFAALRSLTFRGDILEGLKLLRLITGELQDLNMYLVTADVFQMPAVQDISSHIAAQSSRLGKLSLTFEENGAARAEPVRWTSLSPLLSCAHVVEFNLNWKSSTRLDLRDAHIHAITEAWPRLRSLQLRWSATGDRLDGLVDETAVTLKSLASLGRGCPKLREVYLQGFNAKCVPRPPPGPVRRQPIFLRFAEAPIAQPEPVAAFLSVLWRSVIVVPPYHDPNDENSKHWRAVESMLDMMKCHRAMEVWKKNKSSGQFPAKFRSIVVD